MTRAGQRHDGYDLVVLYGGDAPRVVADMTLLGALDAASQHLHAGAFGVTVVRIEEEETCG